MRGRIQNVILSTLASSVGWTLSSSYDVQLPQYPFNVQGDPRSDERHYPLHPIIYASSQPERSCRRSVLIAGSDEPLVHMSSVCDKTGDSLERIRSTRWQQIPMFLRLTRDNPHHEVVQSKGFLIHRAQHSLILTANLANLRSVWTEAAY